MLPPAPLVPLPLGTRADPDVVVDDDDDDGDGDGVAAVMAARLAAPAVDELRSDARLAEVSARPQHCLHTRISSASPSQSLSPPPPPPAASPSLAPPPAVLLPKPPTAPTPNTSLAGDDDDDDDDDDDAGGVSPKWKQYVCLAVMILSPPARRPMRWI
jgi:hypothetical protein